MSVVKRIGVKGSKLQLRATVVGSATVMKALQGVKEGVRNRVLKSACRKQAGKAAKVAKAYLFKNRTGQLRRAIGSVYRSYKSGRVWVFVAGPRKGFRIQISQLTAAGQRTLLKRLGKRRKRELTPKQATRVLKKWVDPTNYAHLVEGGRKPVRAGKKVLSDGSQVFGKAVGGVGPRPFMEPAAAAVAGSRDELTRDISDGIGREVAKYAAKGKSVR